mmetsp:Transcript_22083/g.40501  ORF Transcript_22083/g.40501 Transcript_22083/m.40501 type:complete len:104 (+) Transcript_22083:1090-1401(+)
MKINPNFHPQDILIVPQSIIIIVYSNDDNVPTNNISAEESFKLQRSVCSCCILFSVLVSRQANCECFYFFSNEIPIAAVPSLLLLHLYFLMLWFSTFLLFWME